MVVPQYRPGEPQAFGTDDFLHSIVTPFYKMIESEIAGRAKDPVASRVMYDDITECFWQRAMVDLLMPLVNDRPGCTREQLAYPHLRKLLSNPHLAAATLVKQRRLSGDVLAAAKKSGRHSAARLLWQNLPREAWLGPLLPCVQPRAHVALCVLPRRCGRRLQWLDMGKPELCVHHARDLQDSPSVD